MIRLLVAVVVALAVTPCQAGRAHDPARTGRPVVLIRARAGVPLLVSASAGAIWDRRGFRPECRTTCDLRGLLVQAELGLRGAQVAVGYGALVADRLWSPGWVSDPYAGIAVKGVVTRTWDGVGVSPDRQWLAGVEVEAAISRINLSVGLLRTFDVGAYRGWEWTGGVGWGF